MPGTLPWLSGGGGRMLLEPMQYGLGGLAGAVVGLTLGLFGGGGSILAVPLLVYLVGITNPHLAIGTSALSVSANAFMGMANHARAGAVKWRSAGVYAMAGIVGAALGSTLGKAIDGQSLLFLFALLMIFVAVITVRKRHSAGDPNADCGRENAPRVAGFGAATGAFAGFFGIGGGFLIVPGLIASTGMPMINAIGSSLVVVAALGLTTAANYALSGWVDWGLAAAMVIGGMAGSRAGAVLARRLSTRRGALPIAFSGLIVLVAFYMLWKSAAHLQLGLGG